MKKCLYLIIMSSTLSVLFFLLTLSPAFASSRKVTIAQHTSVASIKATQAHFHPPSWQEHTQIFRGTTYTHLHLTFRGHTQNNSGNQGYNRGYNRSFGNNGGNLVVNRGRASQFQRTRQIFFGESYSASRLEFVGYRQNNTGNQGVNDGVNEDHGGNGGNQIVN